jgi:hypothetical protein
VNVTQQQLSLGFSLQMNRAISMDFTWVHGFHNSIRGPVPAREIPIPNPTIELTQSIDSWAVGVGVKY